MKKVISFFCALALISCNLQGITALAAEETASAKISTEASSDDAADAGSSAELVSDKEYIEETLNLANNSDYTWSYDAGAGAWVMSIVSAVAYPEIPDEQGVSVCVPGAYVTGLDTDGDGTADVTADNYTEAVNGQLVIDYDAQITSTNGQVYTAAEAPVILNTGAAGYGSSTNTTASTTYAKEGYINVSCGNRGKQDTVTDADGNTSYTGDAPSCLCDQKAAARFVKYNILLGNLPGNTEYFVSTGGSGGGAHAAMFAATSNNPDFWPYQEAAGAVGVYLDADGNYVSSVTINGEEVALSDGAWGCIAYSAITSLEEADMALAFEYYLDTDYSFGSSFQKKLAEYLSQSYMEYINEQNLSVNEADVGFDLDGDGAMESTVALTIEYDEEKYADTNGYGGSYLDLYLAEFTSNLQWYLDHLDYAEDWTWFDAGGNALSDEDVAAMTSADKAQAFLEGRYAKSSSSSGGPDGMGMGGGRGGMGDLGGAPGNLPDDLAGSGELPDGNLPDGDLQDGNLLSGELPGGEFSDNVQSNGELSDSETTTESLTENTAAEAGSLSESNSSDESGSENESSNNGLSENEVTDSTLSESEASSESQTESGSLTDGALPDGNLPDGNLPSGDLPDGNLPDGSLLDGDLPDGNLPDGDLPGGNTPGAGTDSASGDTMIVGTPDAGTTQSASGSADSANYSSYEEMLASYQEDIAEIEAGDQYGNNLVSLYNPLNYIGAEDTEDASWVRIVMGAAEGDMSMFSSLNLELAWLNAGTACEIEWQWDGGHVPSEVLGSSFSLYVDQMYGLYAGGQEISAPEASAQTTNGTASEATGTDLTGYVDGTDLSSVSLSLSAAVSYRTAGASKAMPAFDVIDYGQEDYVFGNAEKDARHWDSRLLTILEEYADELSALFNADADSSN